MDYHQMSCTFPFYGCAEGDCDEFSKLVCEGAHQMNYGTLPAKWYRGISCKKTPFSQ